MDYEKAGSSKSLYDTLEQLRAPFLDRAREVAKLTLPFIMPPAGSGPSSAMETPWSALGGRGVNNLSAKMLLSLVPPSPFFRLSLDNQTLARLGDTGEMKLELEAALMEAEIAIVREIEKASIRPAVYEAFRHLIIAGNCLLYLPDEGGIRVYHLDNYVIKRDPMGNVEHIVTKEVISPSQLDPELLKQIRIGEEEEKGEYEVYTCIKATDKDKYEIFQEVAGYVLEESLGTYTADSNPYIPLRLNVISGESYGRGLGEEVIGDLKTSSGLVRSLVEATAASAKVMFLVSPNGSTRARQLAECENGAIIQGNMADVGVVQVQKHADLRVCLETIKLIGNRLQHNFLLTQGIQRDAERVTAAEIDVMKQELDAALGGTFSQLSQSFQLPLVKRMMFIMEKKGILPEMPEELVDPVITTGLESLGRTHDLAKLDAFIGGVMQTLGPELVHQFVNVDDYLQRRASALGINTKGLIKSAEEVQQQQQQQQQMALAQKLGGPAIGAMSQQETKRMELEAQQEPEPEPG